MRRAELFEEGERLRSILLVQPASVPKLDERPVAAELLDRPAQVVEREILVDDVRGELEEDASELACGSKRFESAVEAGEHLGAKLARGPMDAASLVERGGLPQVGRKLFRLDRVAGHDPEGLHVHDEAGGVRSAQREAMGSSGSR